MGNATRVGKFAAGIALALGMAAPALAANATITVPDDFVAALSDTRATGHYEVVGTGLRVWTESNTSTDKVAEYVATDTPLADAGQPTLDYTADHRARSRPATSSSSTSTATAASTASWSGSRRSTATTGGSATARPSS